METVGERIKNIRDGLGLSMESFAQMIGVSSKVIINTWEKGRAEPSIKHLCAIAKAGNKTLDWLLKGENVYTNTAGEELANTEFILFLQDANDKLKKQLNDIQKIIVVTDGPQKYGKVAEKKEEYKK